MTGLSIVFAGNRAGQQFRIDMALGADAIRAAAKGALTDAAAQIQTRGAQNIASAGRFGSRWTEGLHADVSEDGASIVVTHDVQYFSVFQYGKTISGKPMLWIPLSFGGARGVSAKDYPGRLFRVDRKGGKSPLLMTPGAGGAKAQAVYFGRTSVTIPKKFMVVEIVAQVARTMGDLYKSRRAA